MSGAPWRDRRNGGRPLGTGRRGTPSALAARNSAGRNGARPLGTGRPPADATGWGPEAGRNGARPLGTGRLWPVSAVPHSSLAPQWSPSAGDGTTEVDESDPERPVVAVPQWSPSAGDGTTRRLTGRRVAKLLAAMEPVRWGRDDVAVHRQVPTGGRPQWSPSAGDGTTPGRTKRPGATAGRNGARPLGTGRHFVGIDTQRFGETPQWSPSAGDGTTGHQPRRGVELRERAAMEPVRWGRDDASDPNAPPEGPSAAMEPVRWGRDDSIVYGNPLIVAGPQWSPSAGDGTTITGGGPLRSSPRPQWSPSAGDGTTGFVGCGFPVARAAMEPVRWGRDDPQ